MLRFFRTIRKKLIVEDNVRKYLLYAIGEILLVVIGILIALSINNWNEEKKAYANTKIYVDNLIEELKKDHLVYEEQIRAAQIKFQYCKQINEIINENKPIKDTSAFIINLQAAGRLILPSITDNTYKDLVNTGNLKLIKDKKSIDAIREYYSNPLTWWYEDYKNQLVNGYLPLVVDAIPMHLHEEILTNEIVDNFKDFTDNALLNNKVEVYSINDIETILDALRGNKEFTFNLKRITRSHLIQVKILGLSDISAQSLQKTLEQWKTTN